MQYYTSDRKQHYIWGQSKNIQVFTLTPNIGYSMNKVLIRQFGLRGYPGVYKAMAEFTSRRDPGTADEIWCLEHEPVFTLGLAGRTEHLLDPGNIPVHKVDRGGQVTYHGPGQLVVYPLFDLKRRGISIRRFVNLLEQSVIEFLAAFDLEAVRRKGMPGVYLADSKIAALGVRVRRGCCYHGLALNVNMDLSPFKRINPCGYPGLEVTQLADRGFSLSADDAAEQFLPCLLEQFGCDEVETYDERNISFPEIMAASVK